MSAGALPVLASCNFAPANPVVSSRMLNLAGLTAGNVVQAQPARIAAGNYQVQMNGELVRQQVSVVKDAHNAAGTSRIVSCVPSASALGVTVWNIFIRDDAAALTDDALNVEMTIHRLPVVPAT